jgi:hypothetical protein
MMDADISIALVALLSSIIDIKDEPGKMLRLDRLSVVRKGESLSLFECYISRERAACV